MNILILGHSGSGKSATMRNCKPEDLLVINTVGKPLPFKNKFEVVVPRYEKLTDDIIDAITRTNKKIIVIDDAQYIMSFQYMRRIKENGWDKWNDIQGDFFQIIRKANELSKDKTVYFLSHTQRDDEGFEKIKTMGKMLDEKITIEGLFTIVLKTSVADGHYYLLTQNNGKDTVKSPIGLFESYAIDNDLAYVDAKIRNYYELDGYKSDEEIKAMDQESEKPEVVKPDGEKSKRRQRKERNDNKEEVIEEAPSKKEEEEAEAEGTAETTEFESKPVVGRRRRRRNLLSEAVEIDDEELPF